MIIHSYDMYTMANARHVAPSQAALEKHWASHRVSRGERAPIPHPETFHPEMTVYACIREGRWAVLCPFCPSAQYGSPADPKFHCVNCGLLTHTNQWLRVLYPQNWQDIEKVLDVRPNMYNRNWEPDETLDDLLAENLAHADEIRERVASPQIIRIDQRQEALLNKHLGLS